MNNDQPCTRVFLEEVTVYVSIGYTERERQPGMKSRLLVSVDLVTDRTVWKNPAMEDVMDYARVFDYLQTWEQRDHVEFLETLADDLAEFCLADTKVRSCRVVVAKPDIFANARSAGVEIIRRRDAVFS